MKTIKFNLTPGELQKGHKINEELRSIDENFKEIVEQQSAEQVLTADELAAIQGAATPSSENVFATMADLPIVPDPPTGATGSYTTADSTVTVENGIITAITPLG